MTLTFPPNRTGAGVLRTEATGGEPVGAVGLDRVIARLEDDMRAYLCLG